MGTLAELRNAHRRVKKQTVQSDPMEVAPSDPRLGLPKLSNTQIGSDSAQLGQEMDKLSKREKERRKKRKKALEELLL
jgi:hypothetical protein